MRLARSNDGGVPVTGRLLFGGPAIHRSPRARDEGPARGGGPDAGDGVSFVRATDPGRFVDCTREDRP
jgi:hypothetical protein